MYKYCMHCPFPLNPIPDPNRSVFLLFLYSSKYFSGAKYFYNRFHYLMNNQSCMYFATTLQYSTYLWRWHCRLLQHTPMKNYKCKYTRAVAVVYGFAISSHLCDRVRRVELLSCKYTVSVTVHCQVGHLYCVTEV